MARSLDTVTRELAEVTDLLLAAADDDFATRHELLTRQDALRSEAAAFAQDLDAGRPTQDMIDELLEARSQLVSEVRRYSGRVMMSGPSGTGASAGAVSAEMVTLSLKANAASRVAALTARVAFLEDVLTERGVDLEVVPAAVSMPQAEPAG